jgi:hypothetical protein
MLRKHRNYWFFACFAYFHVLFTLASFFVMIHKLKTYLLVALFIVPLASFAQPRLPKGLQRYQVGYSFPMTKATYKVHNYYFNEALVTGPQLDTTFSTEIKTVGGFGVTVGTHFPVVKLGEKSILAITLDYMYNFMLWDGKTRSFSGFDDSLNTFTYDYDFPINGVTGHMALPIGVDFKYGGEATLDRSNRFSMAFGTGLYPSFNATVFDFDAGAVFKMQPFLKGEVGIHAGITFKVRALYTFGKINYINWSSDPIYGIGFTQENGASLTSKSQLTLSLILMPFSWAWDKGAWW